jgi:Bor protein
MKARLLVLASLLGGCYEITLRSGTPPGRPPVQYDERWHHGFIAGVVEVGGMYDLDKICPHGWSEIHTQTSALNGLIGLFGVNLAYDPQTVTVICAPPPQVSARQADDRARVEVDPVQRDVVGEDANR